MSIPNEIRGIVKCMNLNCITNKESIETRFTVNKAKGELKLNRIYDLRYHPSMPYMASKDGIFVDRK
ncbi:MAG: hypothetical protein RRY15_02210 [Bacteroidales bacterium]